VAIPYGRQSVDEDDIAAVVDVLRGDWLTQGPAVAAFEEAVAEACGAPHAVAFSSGTAGLHAAVAVAGLGPGDELVTSAVTFAASANCALYAGAAPRFADVDPRTWNVSAATVAAALTERTRAVVPVHLAGLPAPVREIRATAGDEVVLIEDAAHAIGARQADEPVGACTHSDMAVFSFHPVKTVTTGEGGAVTTRSAELAAALRAFRTHGLTGAPEGGDRDGGWYRGMETLGLNYRLTDLQAALGRSQLRRLDAFVDRRNAIAARYREALGGLDGVTLGAEPPPGARHGRHLFVVWVGDRRRALYDHLHEHGVRAQVHYLPVYRHPYYERVLGFPPGLCPEAERYYSGCLSLPCFPALTDAEQDRVVALVREVLA
jgi:perosamine synthetase